MPLAAQMFELGPLRSLAPRKKSIATMLPMQ